MPQFDFANFVPQLAWLTVFFMILYFGIVRATLPKIGRVVDEREGQVKGDIATAEHAKHEADRIRDAYEAEMAAARTRAQGEVAEAKAAATRAAEARLAEADKTLEAQAAEAANALEAARQSAEKKIERIAARATADLVVAVGGQRPDEDAALAAVRAVAA